MVSSCGYEFDVTMSHYYTIIEGIVQSPPFNITANLRLWGMSFFALSVPKFILSLYKYIGSRNYVLVDDNV